MQPGSWLKSVSLVLVGFLIGTIVAGLRSTPWQTNGSGHADPERASSRAGSDGYSWLARAERWEVWADDATGRSVALSQEGHVRVIVHDSGSAMHVMTYAPNDPVFQGRLTDVGNDGTVEVATLTRGGCEAF